MSGSSKTTSAASFLSRVKQTIDRHHLIKANDVIYVAVSGGRDSMALLHVLKKIRDEYAFSLQAVHVNHGLRGAESDGDADFVKQVCRNLDIPLIVKNLSGFTLNSPEDKLRDARYAFFERIPGGNSGYKLATAHHLNDQMETVLMRLFHGSGVKGLTGIPVVRGRYIRPFLDVTRDQISAYCRDEKIGFREDTSNRDTTKLRNRIRHELFPVLSTVFGESALTYFEQSRQKLAETYGEFQKLNIPVFKEMLKADKNGYFCSINEFLKLGAGQQLAFLDYCFFNIYNLSLTFTIRRLQAFEKFLELSSSGSYFRVTDRMGILKDRKEFYFTEKEKKALKPTKLFAGIPVHFGSYEISLKAVSADDVRFKKNPDIEYICGDGIRLPLVIRSWQKGDIFRPLGQKGRQKVSDYFINKKLNVLQKEQVPLIVDGESLVWIAGMRLDARYKMGENCRTVYMLTITEREKC